MLKARPYLNLNDFLPKRDIIEQTYSNKVVEKLSKYMGI